MRVTRLLGVAVEAVAELPAWVVSPLLLAVLPVLPVLPVTLLLPEVVPAPMGVPVLEGVPVLAVLPEVAPLSGLVVLLPDAEDG